ncbi:MAG TPA: dinitrogenase iron-molybdenum cofactor [Thermoprotei archaeon]|nr:dinitrogenase iron-molybdenum cofactor [Thermoprotei archaeon]
MNMHKIRVAIGVCEDDTLCMSHFGDLDYYMIYDVYVEGGDIDFKFVEKRLDKAKEVMEKVHGDPNKFKAIINVLPDVDVFAGLMFGPNIRLILSKTSKMPIVLK